MTNYIVEELSVPGETCYDLPPTTAEFAELVGDNTFAVFRNVYTDQKFRVVHINVNGGAFGITKVLPKREGVKLAPLLRVGSIEHTALSKLHDLKSAHDSLLYLCTTP
jgi:hypothetical protein